jgi:endonuclease VIII-like 1
MPEISEVKYMVKFVKQACKGKTFNKIGISTVTKNLRPVVDFDQFTISAESRGKEMKLIIESEKQCTPVHLFMSMGMTGHWVVSELIPDHCHLWLKETYDNLYLCFIDPRRFGHWKQQNKWSETRGSDPTTEYSEFKKYILDRHETYLSDKPLYSSLMNQKYFNGVGNYLRAEILYRAFVDRQIKPHSTFSELTKSEVSYLCQLTRDICKESYKVGGGEFMSWENPEGVGSKDKFKEWLQCYRKEGMCHIKDKQGRTFWYHPDLENEFKL